MGWQISMGLGDSTQALSYAEQLFQITKRPDALALEARSMLAAARSTDAMVVIDHALLTLDPSPPLSSELYFLRSRAGSANPLTDLRTALIENPDNGEALSAMADILADQKEFRKALEYAKHASELDPDNAALAQRAAEMSKLAQAGQ
jgi:tetratricopeptide (TPR) repeat protein